MLVFGAYAAQPTILSIGLVPAQIGLPVLVRAGMWPRTLQEGTVAFSADGAPIAGCESVEVKGGDAFCYPVFQKLGKYRIEAKYSGTENFWPCSGSAPLTVGKLEPWTYLAVDPAVPVYGQGLILHALALGAEGMPNPTGTFTFSDGGRVLVTRPLREDGRAALDMPLDAGDHNIEAVYNGNDIYLAARPVKIPVTVTKGYPVVAISSTPAQVSQTVTLTASVTARNPTGTMTFTGIESCVDVPLLNGIAQCRTTYREIGQYRVQASYSGDSNLRPGVAEMWVAVGRAAPGVYLALTPESPVVGQMVRVSALAMAATKVAAPTGAVIFSTAGQPAVTTSLDGDGRASFAGQFAAGLHEIKLTYGGDANYGPSEKKVSFVAAKASTTTSITAAGGVLTATVTPVAPGSGSPTGSVRFTRDGAAIGTATLEAAGPGASAAIQYAEAGRIGAEYAGDLNFLGSISGAAPAASPSAVVTVTSDQNPAQPGKTVTITATVQAKAGTTTPTGSVDFTAGGVPIGKAALSGGKAVVATVFAPGSHSIVATYSGDGIYPAASGNLTQVVGAAPSGMSVSANLASSFFGQAVTFTAQLPAGGTGVVKFSSGTVLLGAAALAGGSASVTVATLPAGTHTITASWPGDGTIGAGSAETSFTVARARTATSLSMRAGLAFATVTVIAPGTGLPTGGVRFLDAETQAQLASGTLVGAAASATIEASKPVVAIYAGDDNFEGSMSAPVSPLTAVNAASYATEVLARESIVTVFGPIPPGASMVRVKDSMGVEREARILFAAMGQATFVMPADVATGRAVVTIGGVSAMPMVGPVGPGVFTQDASGKGAPAGLAEAIEIGDDGTTIVLYGTGLRHAKKVASSVGEVEYAGAQSEFPGLDQVNLRLPVSLRGAGETTIVLSADGVAANAVVVRIR
jgi:uncharacterized protein (TIGR03437 family)